MADYDYDYLFDDGMDEILVKCLEDAMRQIAESEAATTISPTPRRPQNVLPENVPVDQSLIKTSSPNTNPVKKEPELNSFQNLRFTKGYNEAVSTKVKTTKLNPSPGKSNTVPSESSEITVKLDCEEYGTETENCVKSEHDVIQSEAPPRSSTEENTNIESTPGMNDKIPIAINLDELLDSEDIKCFLQVPDDDEDNLEDNTNNDVDYGSDCSTVCGELEPDRLPNLDAPTCTSNTYESNADNLSTGAIEKPGLPVITVNDLNDSGSERSPKIKKKRKTIICSDESSDEEEEVGTGHKKLQKMVYSDQSDDADAENTPKKSVNRQNTRRGRIRKTKLFSSEDDRSDTERISEDEVDKTLILSSDDEKNGRAKKRKRKERERRRTLNEVKKNWKDRQSTEDSSPFKRIKTAVLGDSSQELEDGLTNDIDEDRGGDVSATSDEDVVACGVNNYHRHHMSAESADGSVDSFINDSRSDVSDEEGSLDGFIEEDSQTDSLHLDEYLPQMRATKFSLREAFGHYLSVLVNGALDPDFLKPEYIKSHADYESLIQPSVRKIEVAIDSKLNLSSSSAWMPSFREMLEGKSFMKESSMSRRDGCEACQRSGRIASIRCEFSGHEYNRETLEIYHNDTEQDFIPVKVAFRVGRFCASRSKAYHPLYHFKFKTFQSCKKKVNYVKENRLYNDDQDIFDQCMKDTPWIEERFRMLKWALNGATRYASEDRKVFN